MALTPPRLMLLMSFSSASAAATLTLIFSLPPSDIHATAPLAYSSLIICRHFAIFLDTPRID